MRLLRWKLAAVTALLVAIAVFRLVVRDRVPQWAFVYYMTPWPLLCGSAAVLAWFWFMQRKRRLFWANATLALGFLGLWIVNWGWHFAKPGQFRLVLWNVAKPGLRLPGVLERLRQTQADIIAVAEMQPKRADYLNRWTMEGYSLAPLPGNLLLMVRGEVLATRSGELNKIGVYNFVQVRVRGREQTILFVDLNAVPLSSRKSQFAALMPLLERRERLILVGDLNTPRDSFYFDAVRAGFKNSFECSGLGLPETWPMPLPVLSLDQVWFGEGITPKGCRLKRSLWSDHVMVVADYDME